MKIIKDNGNGCSVTTYLNVDRFNEHSENLDSSEIVWPEGFEPSTPQEFWSIDSGSIVEDSDGASNKEQEYMLSNLYNSAIGYQKANIDGNMKDELDKAENLLENGTVQQSDLPKNNEVAQWLESSLWGLPADSASKDGSYYSRKNYILAGNYDVSYDFSNIGAVPHNYSDIRTERKTFLAS